jgi:hypothetical protein
MRRKLLNFITAISLALFVALLGMTVASWRSGNIAGWRQQRTGAKGTTQDDVHLAAQGTIRSHRPWERRRVRGPGLIQLYNPPVGSFQMAA